MADFRSREWQSLSQPVQKQLEAFQNVSNIQLGEVARALGLIVKVSTLPANISGEIRPSNEAKAGFIIRINRHESKVRQRFTLAHEISHYLLHRNQIGKGISDTVLYRSSLSNTLEAEANRLAADLIMPWNILKEKIRSKDIRSENVIAQIASELEVSKIALKIRLGLEN